MWNMSFVFKISLNVTAATPRRDSHGKWDQLQDRMYVSMR